MEKITTKKQLLDILNNLGTFTTTILVYLYSKYDTEFIEWDAITFSQIIKEDLGDYPSQSLLDKFGAGTSLFANNLFFTDLVAFNSICSVLNKETAVTETWLPADLDAALWGCTEAKLLLGELYTDEVFSDDIRTYVGLLLSQEGMYKPPAIASFAVYPEGTEENVQDNLSVDPIYATLKYEKDEQTKLEITDLINKQLATVMTQISKLPIDIDRGYVDMMLQRMSTLNVE
jgi:hypothetical protein